MGWLWAGDSAVTAWQSPVAARPSAVRLVVGAGADTRMDFRILGRLEVLEEDRAVTLAGSKQRALLALLVLHANDRHQDFAGARLAFA